MDLNNSLAAANNLKILMVVLDPFFKCIRKFFIPESVQQHVLSEFTLNLTSESIITQIAISRKVAPGNQTDVSKLPLSILVSLVDHIHQFLNGLSVSQDICSIVMSGFAGIIESCSENTIKTFLMPLVPNNFDQVEPFRNQYHQLFIDLENQLVSFGNRYLW